MSWHFVDFCNFLLMVKPCSVKDDLSSILRDKKLPDDDEHQIFIWIVACAVSTTLIKRLFCTVIIPAGCFFAGFLARNRSKLRTEEDPASHS